LREIHAEPSPKILQWLVYKSTQLVSL
jgi:hypothetical protein